MTYRALRNLLFMLPPEVAHDVSLHSINLAGRLNLAPLIAREVPPAPVTVMGIEFPNPVGLAAGLDKDGRYIDGLAALGFGFIEVGTVTPKPQAGNPSPRMFRLPQHQALINRLGFNNDGVEALCRRVEKSRFRGVLGINIGKNKDTPVESALDDYLICLRRVYDLASYITVNISSPNTPGLRDLQDVSALDHLLEGLKAEHARLVDQHERYVPLVVKIAPDMSDDALVQMASQLKSFDIDGVIVSNTTVERTAVAGHRHAGEAGGLSGAPLRDKSNHALAIVAGEIGDSAAVIGVGGICSGEDAAEKIRLGADLVQIYTGFIYAGPQLVYDSVKAFTALQQVSKAGG